MIRKFIIVGRQLYLQNEHPDGIDEENKPVELLMPVEVLWKLDKMIKDVDYLLASNEPRGDIEIARNRIIDFIQPYAVAEKDRMWLIGKIDRGDEL